MCVLYSEATSVSTKGVHMPTVRPSVETGLRDAAVQIAAGTTVPPTTHHITPFQLYDALQVNDHHHITHNTQPIINSTDTIP